MGMIGHGSLIGKDKPVRGQRLQLLTGWLMVNREYFCNIIAKERCCDPPLSYKILRTEANK